MQYRPLGALYFHCSAITFGGASISGQGRGYGFGDISKAESLALLHAALEHGINTFDTAPIYGFRESEKRMGEAFKGIRERAFLVSKSGVSWHENGRVDMNNDPKIAQKMFEQSLKDLQTDYIDLYMVHWPDKKHDIRETLKVYQKAQKDGRIRFIGLCNTTLEELKKAQEIVRVDVIQSEHHYFNQAPIVELKSALSQGQIGFMGWGTLDKGILSGRVTADRVFDQFDCRKKAPWFKKQDVLRKVQRVEGIKKVLDKHGVSLLEFAIGVALKDEEVSSVLCGVKTIKQLEQVVAAVENRPSTEVFGEVAQL